MTRRRKISLGGLILCIVAGFFSSVYVIGSEARLVQVLTIFFSGFGGGASLVAFIKKKSE
jgi:hypothetical protein